MGSRDSTISFIFKTIAAIAILGSSSILTTCSPFVSRWDQVLEEGIVRVGTLNGITSYYNGPHGETGFDFDLLVELAGVLNIEVELSIAESRDELARWIRQNRIHIAAADLVIERDVSDLRFTQPLRSVTQRLVYSRDRRRPRKMDAVKLPVLLPEARQLSLQPLQVPDSWTVVSNNASAEEILHAVARRDAAFALISSDLLAIHRRYLTGLRSAFQVGDKSYLGWAMGNHADHSLFNRVVGALEQLSASGSLQQIRDKHFGHIRRMDILSNETLEQHIASRLPKYEKLFKKAAGATSVDWRLLAAIGYQESHWNPKAKSPTGVRGLMMLTRATAKEMGVKNRKDAAQSIDGGAKYFARLKRRLPEHIDEPDRSWLALASYNLGYGHLLDIRKINRQRGKDPDLWVDIREALPLLTEPKWYKNTKYGYARGYEAITYVENIRSYYDVLRFRFPNVQQRPDEKEAEPEKRTPRRYGPRRR